MRSSLLDVKDGVCGIRGVLILRGITDKTLIGCESDVGRSNTVSLIIDQNFDTATLHNTNTSASNQISFQFDQIDELHPTSSDGTGGRSSRVGSSQIDTNNSSKVIGIILRSGRRGQEQERS